MQPMQAEVIERVEGLVAALTPSALPPPPQAALQALLRTKSVYEEAPAGNMNPAAYQSELLSLPASLVGCPCVTSLLPAEDHPLLEA
jgi:hypothetical protein